MTIPALAIHETTLLERCETRIKQGISTFLEVGDALLTIRDDRLYRATHSTFEEYCQERWSIERRRAYQLISAAQVIRNVQDDLSVNRGTHSPLTERQVRPLTSLGPAEQRKVWAQVVQEHPEGNITGAKVQEVIDQANGDTEEFREYERVILLPRLHDAGLQDAPQILSGQDDSFQAVPEQRQEEAKESLRQSILDILALCRQGHSVDECADEILDILGQSSSSIAIAARFGIALTRGPQTLADLTAMAIEICSDSDSARNMPRDDYLRWRKRVLRLVDSLTYSGCGIFEHTLANGQLVYALREKLP